MKSGNYEKIASEQLFRIWELLDLRNRQLGWARYDYADLDSHPWIEKIKRKPIKKLLRYSFRSLDLVAPISFHALVKMPKQIVPTAFYHVGMAYLYREHLGIWAPSWGKEQVEVICEAALERRLNAEYVCWEHPYPAHASAWRMVNSNNVPSSCAHHVARLGTLLLETGQTHAREDLIEKGISAAQASLAYHNWHDYEDGTCTVSYYPDTHDETINTCVDVAALFASIPKAKRPPECQARLEAILRMALKEQQTDGSWYYCTNRHYVRYQEPRITDNHHSAQVIQALAKVLSRGSLPVPVAAQLRVAIEKGLKFYIDHFYRDDGTGYYFPNLRKPLAHVVAYCEGLAAIYWGIHSGVIQQGHLKTHSLALIPKMVSKSIEFFDPGTGDVACSRILGRNYHLQSLRWGSGPLMEGLIYALLLMK